MVKLGELKAKYGKKAILVIVVLIALTGVIFGSKWMAGRAAQALEDSLRNAFRFENQSLYDNLAVLKDRTQQLEDKYDAQKIELDTIRKINRGGTTVIFKNPDKKVIASYFDNTIDQYVSDK